MTTEVHTEGERSVGTAGQVDTEHLLAAAGRLRAEVGRRIVGQERVVEEVILAMMAGGHALLVGVPGLAKTLMISSIAQAMSLEFRRIQFTPDLVPSDITGTEILEEDAASGTRRFRFVRGPIFANIVLADEINRTPPRTQAALLEAMQEQHVTAAGETMTLPRPFFVLATQNPIEQEGTYPLPEAQLDRFLFNIRIGYPAEEEEVEILRATTAVDRTRLEPVIDWRGGARAAASRARDAGLGHGPALRGGAGAGDPSGAPRCAGDRAGIRALGRRAARRAGAGAGRQGLRAAQRSSGGGAGGHPARRAAGAASPCAAQLRRGGGGGVYGAGDRGDPRARSGAVEQAVTVGCRSRRWT